MDNLTGIVNEIKLATDFQLNKKILKEKIQNKIWAFVN